jgi:8-oxo-dGTP diphosphatase
VTGDGPAPLGPLVTVALAVVLNETADVLVTRRQAGEHLEGLREFPGGKVQPGEPPDEAARRELLEETGIDLPRDAFEPLTFVPYHYGDRKVLLLVFLAARRMSDAAARAARAEHEEREAEWVERADLDELEMPPANAAILTALEKRLARDRRA